MTAPSSPVPHTDPRSTRSWIATLQRGVAGALIVGMTGLSLASIVWNPFPPANSRTGIPATTQPTTAPSAARASSARGNGNAAPRPTSRPGARGGDDAKPVVKVLSADDQVRVVQHAAGVTRVPLHPQRIVAVDYADECMALGVKPFAVVSGRSYTLVPDYLMDQLPDAMRVPAGHLYDPLPSLDYIASYEPDLILKAVRDDLHTFEQYSSIGPTVSLATPLSSNRIVSEDGNLVALKRRLMDLTRVLGREAQGRQYIKQFDERLKHDASTWGRVYRGRTVAVFRTRWQRWLLCSNVGAASGIFEALQIKCPPQGRDLNQPLDLEDLLGIDADYIIIAHDDTVGAPQEMARMERSDIWKKMRAVRAGRVLELHTICNYWQNGGLIAKTRMLDDLEKLTHLGTPLPALPDESPDDSH